MLGVLRQMLPADLSILVLPRRAIGKSNEHSFALGTLTLTPDVLIKAWTDIGLCVNKTGIRKLLIIEFAWRQQSDHGHCRTRAALSAPPCWP